MTNNLKIENNGYGTIISINEYDIKISEPNNGSSYVIVLQKKNGLTQEKKIFIHSTGTIRINGKIVFNC
jgi:hypothetical protein